MLLPQPVQVGAVLLRLVLGAVLYPSPPPHSHLLLPLLHLSCVCTNKNISDFGLKGRFATRRKKKTQPLEQLVSVRQNLEGKL